MIRLLRVDGVEILVNCSMITGMDQIDGATVLTLEDKEKLKVKNHPKDIVEKMRACQLGIEAGNTDETEEEK